MRKRTPTRARSAAGGAQRRRTAQYTPRKAHAPLLTKHAILGRQAAQLGVAEHRAAAALAMYDWSTLEEVVASKHPGLDRAVVLVELRRFLVLKARAGGDSGGRLLSPPLKVDQAWHCLMLLPEDYLRLGEAMLETGRVPGHNPLGAHDRAARAERFERTVAMYEEVFGEAPPADVWREGAEQPLLPTQERTPPQQQQREERTSRAQASASLPMARRKSPRTRKAPKRFSEGTEALSDIQRRALSIPAPPAQQLQTEPSPEKWIGYISIHVDYQNGLRRSFKIKPHSRMSALLRICARTSGAEYVSVLLDGRRVGDSDTPASLGMEDGVSALHVSHADAYEGTLFALFTDHALPTCAPDRINSMLCYHKPAAERGCTQGLHSTRNRSTSTSIVCKFRGLSAPHEASTRVLVLVSHTRKMVLVLKLHTHK